MGFDDPTSLFLSILFGSIGMGYSVYGKKHNSFFLIAGLGLMVFTFFDMGATTMFFVGLILVALPFLLNKFLG